MMQIKEVAKYLPDLEGKQLPDRKFFFAVSLNPLEIYYRLSALL
jgi:hypothetical protein